jgi:hypothetical protein
MYRYWKCASGFPRLQHKYGCHIGWCLPVSVTQISDLNFSRGPQDWLLSKYRLVHWLEYVWLSPHFLIFLNGRVFSAQDKFPQTTNFYQNRHRNSTSKQIPVADMFPNYDV